VVVVPHPRPNPGFGVCRSKKRAVLIGIKYTSRRAGELRGPINDVKCMKHLLTTRFGFPCEGIIVLTGKNLSMVIDVRSSFIRGAY
jgi:hypothetical protein